VIQSPLTECGIGGGAGEGIPYLELFGHPSVTADVGDQVAGFLNLCCARSVLEENLDRRLRCGAGVTLAQHELLYRLSLAPGGRLRMADLADMLLASKSGASRLVDRMAAVGLVARESSGTDRRLVFAVLTATGKAALVRSRPVFLTGVTSVFGQHLDDQDRQALQRILRKLLVAHSAWDDRRCQPPVLAAGTNADFALDDRLPARGPESPQ
jgi:DNA-binding MarR family transcriptional regulator